jgi:RHS repeat-associated protein
VVENGTTTYYLRYSVLGGQVISELNSSGAWMRGYVYLGGQLVAIQSSLAVSTVHQDPITKSQRITDSSGNLTGTIVDLDPWGGETGRSSNQAFQAHRFTSYDRDANGGDDAMMRRYQSSNSRFHQPDPYDGSYNLTDPQSLNRYAYTQNDPVNFVDPSGLNMAGHGFCYLVPVGVDPIWGEFVIYEQRCVWWISSGGPIGGGLGPEDPGPGGGEPVPEENSKDRCDDSPAAVTNAANSVANNIPGATVTTQGGQTVINFKENYFDTVARLNKAGYYSGILAYNPIDHSGGTEFRTYGSPGFHFKVAYPQVRVAAPIDQRLLRGNRNQPATATDLHIDCHNPVGSGVKGTVNHALDFVRGHTPYWLPPLIFSRP